MPPTAWTRAREREAWREGASRGRGLARWRRCGVPLRSLRFHCRPPACPSRVRFPRRLGEARRAVARQRFRHASAAIGGGGGRRWPRRPGGALAAGAAVRPVPVGAGGGYRGARIAAARFVGARRPATLRRQFLGRSAPDERTRITDLAATTESELAIQRAARRGRAARPDVVLVLVLLLVSAIPAATHEHIALGGPMRFATHDIAFVGWFVGAQADV